MEKENTISQYCYDLAKKIYDGLSGVPVSSKSYEIYNIAITLYKEFETLDKFGMIDSKYWNTVLHCDEPLHNHHDGCPVCSQES